MRPTLNDLNKRAKRVVKKISVFRLLKIAENLLHRIGIESYKLDAKLLMRSVLNFDDLELELNKQKLLSIRDINNFFSLLRKRLTFEPIAYILGSKEFYGLDFFVNKNCLIPRPDTETIVEHCLKLLSKFKNPLVFELCTGSGAIAVSLAKNSPESKIIASDISLKALNIAKKNAKRHEVDHRISFLQGDLFEPFNKCNQKADLIVANPPYISQKEMHEVATDVYLYEPHLALIAYDELGIDVLKKIIVQSQSYLANDGFLVLEMGYKQSEYIKEIASEFFVKSNFFQDLAGHTRGVILSGFKNKG